MCEHKEHGTCLGCYFGLGRAAGPALAENIGDQGYWSLFGAPGTPVDEARYVRYNKDGTAQTAEFTPLSDVSTITNPTHYREASPTGKHGGVLFFARISNPLVTDGAVSETLSFSPRATPATARIITRAQVDPWGSSAGKPSWTPGDVGKTVSG